MPATSYIDLFVRQTAATWSAMLDCDVELPPPSQHPVKLPFTGGNGGTSPEEKSSTTLTTSNGKVDKDKDRDKDKPRIEVSGYMNPSELGMN